MGIFDFLRKGAAAGGQPQLRPITADEAYGELAGHYSTAQNLLAAGDFASFRALFNQAWHSKQRMPSGERLYQVLLG